MLRQMARSLVMTVFFLAHPVLVVPVSAADSGHIQVICEPGLRVFMDGKFIGTSNASDEGLIIGDVSPGDHRLRFSKVRHVPKELTVSVQSAQVSVVRVGSLIAEVKVSESGEATTVDTRPKIGSIIIRTLPIKCSISASALGLDGSAKSKPEFQVADIPVGSYEFAFVAADKRLTATVRVDLDLTTILFVDFTKNAVSDTNRRQRDAWNKASPPNSAGIRFLRIPGTRYEMSNTKVTKEQWVKIMGGELEGEKRLPVTVTKSAATAFCEKLKAAEKRDYALPEESVWRTAMMANASTRYWFGNDRDDVKNYEHQEQELQPVGTREPNPWGFFDMCGYPHEWISNTLVNERSGRDQEAQIGWMKPDWLFGEEAHTRGHGVWTDWFVVGSGRDDGGFRVVRIAENER